jgi:hypothetical protein
MTTMTSTALAWQTLETALRQQHPVRLSYHGRQRTLCPHALGWKNARPMLLGYQTGGQTSTGTLDPDPCKRWRCLFVDEIEHIVVEPNGAWQTGDNYNWSHPFNTIDEVTVAISPNDPPHAS